MPKILVTGANGFLGKEVVKLLKKNDYDLKSFSEILSNQNELSYNKLIK